MSIQKEQIGDATLYCGDCMEILPTLDKVDAVITDPVWPNNTIPEFSEFDPAALIGNAMGILRGRTDRAAFHLGCDSDPGVLAGVGMPFFRVCWLRYARPHYKGRLLYGADVAYLYGVPPKSYPGAHVISGETCKTDSKGRITEHPCERSEQHVEWLVGKWSVAGETVIDPFMGSGTTGVACAKLGRKFIGIEINEKYFDIAAERITAAYAQGRLFE